MYNNIINDTDETNSRTAEAVVIWETSDANGESRAKLNGFEQVV